MARYKLFYLDAEFRETVGGIVMNDDSRAPLKSNRKEERGKEEEKGRERKR